MNDFFCLIYVIIVSIQAVLFWVEGGGWFSLASLKFLASLYDGSPSDFFDMANAHF